VKILTISGFSALMCESVIFFTIFFSALKRDKTARVGRARAAQGKKEE